MRRPRQGHRCWNGRPAVTLLETLVVISVVAMLASILLPSLGRARTHAQRVTCLSNQRQIAMAMIAYTHDYGDRFPIAQYFDRRALSWVAWDSRTVPGDPTRTRPGIIWEYTAGHEVQQCPAYEGHAMSAGDAFTGYNYNTSYIGRGENEAPFAGLDETPAALAEIRFAGRAALVGDGGFKSGANKFMRAPGDTGTGEGTVLAGAQARRHDKMTNVTYADGHGTALTKVFNRPVQNPYNAGILGWPDNGFLSRDDAAYAHR